MRSLRKPVHRPAQRPAAPVPGRSLSLALAALMLLPAAAVVVAGDQDQSYAATTTSSSVPVLPVISRGVPAFSSTSTAPARNANDDDYASEWASSGTPAWLAYDLSGVPLSRRGQVLASWSNTSYGYTTRYGYHYNNLGAYTIQINTAPGGTAAPTSGWVTKVTVTGNTLHSRQHVLDLAGANWVRLSVTSADGALYNMNANLTTFDLHSVGTATGPVADSFIFYGDSITAGAMCPCPGSGVASLPELVHAADPARWPVMENGGDPYDTSAGAVKVLLGADGHLAKFPGTYVGLSYGMNDAADSTGQAAYYANMKTLVQAVLAAGKTPMIPTISYTADAARNATIPSYNAVIDQLYTDFPQIVRGPDLWSFFSTNRTLLTAGDIHPNAAGYAAIRREWSKSLLSTVYAGAPAPTTTTPAPTPTAAPTTPTTTPTTPTTTPTTTTPPSLRVVGNGLVGTDGKPVRLIGVNHSGTEYACVGGGTQGATGWDVFEPGDFDTNPAYLDAIKTWGSNTVRIGLNEACWLGINGVAPAFSGLNYQNRIRRFVDLATSKGLHVVLELHWSAPGTGPQFVPHGQAPMPNRDHTVTMWQQVANAYKGNTSVVLDLFNEPYPHWNQDNDNAWQCWRDGSDPADPTNSRRCIGTEWWDKNGNAFNGGKGYVYRVAGMQELVTAVRATGAQNLILLSGIQYANSLSKWLTYQPTDPIGNTAAAWHVYPFNICSTKTCWDAQVAPVAAAVPLVTAEIGDSDCRTTFAEPLMTWLDQRSASYQAWTWNAWGCGGMQLMTDYLTGTPTAYGKPFYDHFRRVTAAPTPTASAPAPTPTASAPAPTPTASAPAPTPTATAKPKKPRGWSTSTGTTSALRTTSSTRSKPVARAKAGAQLRAATAPRAGRVDAR